jgi:hypothetical protein
MTSDGVGAAIRPTHIEGAADTSIEDWVATTKTIQ